MTAFPYITRFIVSDRVKAFGNDTGGSFIILFAFCMPVLVALMGCAIDFGNAYKEREQLLLAADAASLDAIAKGSPGLLAAAAMNTDGRVQVAEAKAIEAFYAELAAQNGNLQPVATAEVVKSGLTVTATVRFTVAMPTHFFGVFGVNTLAIDGHATSVNGTPPYIDFYLMLDNSPSMGIAATPTDVDNLITATAGQPGFARNCGFACHELDAPGMSSHVDNYTIAHDSGITTRIDVLRQATQQLMDTAATTASVPGQFGMAINTFNVDMTTVSAMTTDLTAARANAAAIDLMVVPAQGWNDDRDTDFEVSMAQLSAAVPASGTGLTSDDPQRVVFLVTDGVDDTDRSTTPQIAASRVPDPSRLIQAFNPDLCRAMKNQGIKIAVIYTTYVPLPNNGYYNSYVSPWQDEINPNIKACASPGYFFEVSPTQGISEAMTALFRKAVAEARITS